MMEQDFKLRPRRSFRLLSTGNGSGRRETDMPGAIRNKQLAERTAMQSKAGKHGGCRQHLTAGTSPSWVRRHEKYQQIDVTTSGDKGTSAP